ncbi:MAG TPA: CopG family transcriptional regulator [Arachnia sp.]|nr:CopG family transcriptional regulator [Arachnia sp.]HMT85001.1 CopG family transcriptional regulator [Arachnia sp.]
MQRTNIYLEERQTAALDRLAGDEGISRAELIRRLIDRALGDSSDDRTADLDAIEASFGKIRTIEHAPRETDDRDRHLASLWNRP